jgi:hypothetical protein
MASIPVMMYVSYGFLLRGRSHPLTPFNDNSAFFTYVIKAFFIQKNNINNTIGIFECN